VWEVVAFAISRGIYIRCKDKYSSLVLECLWDTHMVMSLEQHSAFVHYSGCVGVLVGDIACITVGVREEKT